MNTRIKCNLSGIIEVFAWCRENVGIEGWAWDVTYTNNADFPHETIFEFKKERDATMFSLKFCNTTGE